MNVDEAREALEAIWFSDEEATVTEALDRYGLACHVEACMRGPLYVCGEEGYYCESAKRRYYCESAKRRWPKQTEAPAPAKQGR